MHCPDCGSEVAEGRRFCGKCGGQLRVASGSVEAVQGIPESPVEAVAPVPRPPLSTRKKLTYALVALVVVLGGVGWWWFHRPAPAYKAEDQGIYPIQALSADGKTVKWGFIDADGKVLIQPQWDDLAGGTILGQLVYFNEGLCGVKKDGKYGYIDTTGSLVIPAQFDAAGPFVEGLAAVKLGNQFGYIDKTGQYAVNPQFSQAGNFHDGLAAVHTDEGWGFIDKTGTDVIKPHFQVADIEGFSDGLAAICDGKCGYVDRSGVFTVREQFDSVGTFAEGLAAVHVSNKWGYIDTSGKIVINPQFDQTTMFSGGLAVVSVSGHVGTIDKRGKFVVNPGQFNIQLGTGDLQAVTSSDGTGLISRDGKWVVRPSKAISAITAVIGRVFYGVIGGQSSVPISISGKVLAGPYKGATLDSLAQDLQNESSALQSMNALTAAEAAYSSAYPARGFTASLDKLGPAQGTPDENHAGLIDAALATGTKDGYQFAASIPEGTSTGGTNFNYFILAKPAAGHVGRTYCADSSGTVHYALPGQECTTTTPAP